MAILVDDATVRHARAIGQQFVAQLQAAARRQTPPGGRATLERRLQAADQTNAQLRREAGIPPSRATSGARGEPTRFEDSDINDMVAFAADRGLSGERAVAAFTTAKSRGQLPRRIDRSAMSQDQMRQIVQFAADHKINNWEDAVAKFEAAGSPSYV